MKKIFLFIIIIPSFLFIIGCDSYYATLTVRSEPPGARIYTNNNVYLGTAPVSYEIEVPDEFLNTASWDVGFDFIGYLDGYSPTKLHPVLDMSSGAWDFSIGRIWHKYYNYILNFETSTTKAGGNDFYISSFQDTKAGELPKKRDSFNKSEIPQVIIVGYKGKVVNIKTYSISSGKNYFDKSMYIPDDNKDTYFHTAITELLPDSYKVECSVEGIGVKTLFFTIFN